MYTVCEYVKFQGGWSFRSGNAYFGVAMHNSRAANNISERQIFVLCCHSEICIASP